MRKLLCFALVMGFAGTASSAGSPWSKPGWYSVGTTFDGPEIEAGPFDDEDSCKATLPDDNQFWTFTCERFDEDPGYPGAED
jgi:hypothetical protein